MVAGGETIVRMVGNKASISLYLDLDVLEKVDEKRGLIKRNTYLANLIKNIIDA